jgi:hypothetical protein
VERPGLPGTPAPDALVETIRATGVRDVVAPGLAHISPSGRHRLLGRGAIERKLGARFWVLR